MRDVKAKELGIFVARKVRRMLIPMYGIYLVYGLVVSLLHLFGFKFGGDLSFNSLVVQPLTNGHQFSINMPMWFLAPFFLAEITYGIMLALVSLVPGSPRVRGALLVIVSFSFGALAIHVGGPEGMTEGWRLLVCRTAFFLPWICVGRAYRRLEAYDKLPNGMYFGIWFLIELTCILLARGSTSYTPSWCEFPHGIILTIIPTIAGIAILLRTSKILSNIIGSNGLVRRIADNSFSIMCHHITGFFLVNSFFALMAKVTTYCDAFDFTKYVSTAAGYQYFPLHINQFAVVYVIAGISFALAIHKVWKNIKNYLYNAMASEAAKNAMTIQRIEDGKSQKGKN